MMYLHLPEYQLMLQTALRERHLRESDAQIVEHGEIGCSAVTLQRFRLANLSIIEKGYQKSAAAKGRRPSTLMLDYTVANQLWKYCRSEIEGLAGDGLFFSGHAEQVAIDALHTFYSSNVNDTVAWKTAKNGLKDTYFCYKPSFRRPNYVVKSRFTFKIIDDNEYLKVSEEQVTKVEGREQASEHSEGFALSKSGRLWLFMREASRAQPRIFCFNKTHMGPQDDELARFFGYVLESDMKFSSGVFNFRVGLVSRSADEQLWKDTHPGVPYNETTQINTVPYPADRGTRCPEDIVFDEDMRKYLRPTMMAGIDPDMLD